MSARLERLLRPKSIAVIGGGFWCENVIHQCRKMGFEGAIWPVHPNKQLLAGEHTFSRIKDLPAAPDAAFVGVNRYATIEAARTLSTVGAGGAVCFAAGFAEAEAETGDGRILQDALVEAAQDMPFLGPNCYGFVNYLDGALLWPDQQGGRRVTKGVAIVTQSSNIAINLTMAARGLDLAYMVTAGNQAVADLADIGESLIDDPRVSALGLHIEGIGNIDAFRRLAIKAQSLGKAVIALKVGASTAAQAATISHTASLAGSDAGADALFRRLGVHRARSLEGFLEALKIADIQGPLGSNEIASMSCSGGEASLMADTGETFGLEFPKLTDLQRDSLRDALGPKVSLANPLDYNTYVWPDAGRMGAAYSAMMLGDLALGIVVSDFPRSDRCSDKDWESVVEGVEFTAKTTGKPMAILSSLPENMPERWADDCATRGIIPLCGMSAGLEAVATMTAREIGNHAPVAGPAKVAQTTTLTEASAKQVLQSHGLQVPKNGLAETATQAADLAEHIGFPVALKGQGHAHKTEAGAVKLGLSSRAEVECAAREMGGKTWLVEEMIGDVVAELLVGVTSDPAHGYVLTIGAGGQLTEILADTQSLLLPASDTEILAALDALRIAPVLEGYRGKPPADRKSILHAINAVQSYVLAGEGRIVEVEVNPLMARPQDAIAADALILMEGS